jgi:hypothetical protein
VFQAFLTTFLLDSGYKTPVQNMEELFASGMKLACPREYNYLFENFDETELSKVLRHRVNCLSNKYCLNWALYQKNVSILLDDLLAEEYYATGVSVGENSEPFLCRLEDGVVYKTGRSMIMFYGDQLLGRVNEIIDRVVEAGIYLYWVSYRLNILKSLSRMIAIVHPLDGYYSFNLYHMQPAFYLLLIGWSLSGLCFMFELLYSCLLKIKC